MTDTRPAPLVPAEVDLRDFPFMPLHVSRLRDSDLASDETPEACWAAVLLWCASWHQVPAGSIPAHDQWLAKQTGYVSRGRIADEWGTVRKGALRGWVECSDGRLYHPVVAEQAIAAWRGKLLQRWKTEAARVKKHNQRHKLDDDRAVQMPEFEEWIALGCPQGHALPVPGDKPPTSPGTPPGASPGNGHGVPGDVSGETPSKRQREGQGQGQGQGLDLSLPQPPRSVEAPGEGFPEEPPGEDPPPLDDDPPPEPTPAGLLGAAMRKAGIHPMRINASDPVALAMLERGVTIAQFAEVAREAVAKKRGDPWRYTLTVLTNRLEKAAEIAAGPAAPVDPMAWRKTLDGVNRRAAELGLSVRTGESLPEWERRVLTAHQRAAARQQEQSA